MTLKRPKDKGTKFETDVVNRGKDFGLDIYRMPASSRYDIHVRGSTGRTIKALVAKQNRGRALATITLEDLFHMLAEHGDQANIECKHLARIALHSIYEEKFA